MKKTNKTGIIIMMLVMLLTSIGAQAQWSSNPAINTAICIATNQQGPALMVTDGAGGAIITWQDARNGAGFDIYAQRINAAGVIQWTLNGIAICTATGSQQMECIAADGAGGAFIAWRDNRGIISVTEDIYAQHINAAGLVQWLTDGIVVCTNQSSLRPGIVSDGSGGAIISWEDYRNGPSNSDIYAQRINASGTPQWTANGIAICNTIGSQYQPRVVTDGAGGAIIAWEDGDIHAQRINASGVVQWTTNGVSICAATNSQDLPVITTDGSGGAIIAWNDSRSGDYDIYAQSINATGSVQWPTDGILICTAANNQYDVSVSSDNAGGAFFSWDDFRGIASDIYAQRINALGVVQWTANGVPVCTAVNDQYVPVIVTDGAGGVIISWEDLRNGLADIYTQRLNGSGTAQWTIDGVATSTATNAQTPNAMVADGSGGAIIAWYDNRVNPGAYDIYAQNINANGTLGCTAPTITCPANQTVNAGANCNATATYTETTTGTAPVSITYSFAGVTSGSGSGNGSGSTFNKGTTTVTLTATNACGNQSCSFDVVVTDVTPPTISCPANVTINTNTGLCSSNSSIGTATATDNCTISLANALHVSGTAPSDNVNSPSFTAFGAQPVTIEFWVKNQNASLSFPVGFANSYLIMFSSGSFTIRKDFVGDYNTGASVDNTGNVWQHFAITYDGVSTFRAYKNGLPTPTPTFTGFSGSSATGTLQVGEPKGGYPFTGTIDELRMWNVERTQAQIAANMYNELGPQAGLQVYYKFNEGTAGGNNTSITSTTDASGNNRNGALTNFALTGTTGNFVSGQTISTIITNNASSSLPLGNTTVTWTATDGSGNTASCTQTVTVIDNQPPTITCPGATTVAANTGSCTYNGSIGTATATDNCGSPTISLSPSGPYNLGNTTVTWKATDASGNSSTCNQTVTVVDNQPPTFISCPSNITLNCGNSLPPTTGLAIMDICAGPAITPSANVTDNNPFCINGRIVTYTWVASDPAGNTASCVQTISFNPDLTPPVFDNCPSSIMLNCGDPLPPLANPTALDGCSGPATILYIGQFDNGPQTCPANKIYTRTWTATDKCGNTASCSQTISYNPDVTPPVISSCPSNITLNCGDPLPPTSALLFMDGCSGSGTTPNAVVTDNGLPCNSGRIVFYTWTATDNCGNTAQCVQTITINITDNIPPTITCPTNVIVNANSGSCVATGVALGTPVVSDNNPGVGTPANNSSGTYSIGTTNVTWTVADAIGNTATCNQTVTVVDNQAPTISCPGASTVTANTSLCRFTGSIGTATATDNCGSPTITGPVPAGPYSVGTTIVTWTATDASGNTATCTQSVTVTNPVTVTITAGGPTTFCQGGSVVLTNTSPIVGGVLWSNGSTTDPTTITVSGNYTVIHTDGNGCSATAGPVTVTVKPNPTASCSHTDVSCNGSADGTASVVAGAGNGTFAYQWTGAGAQTTTTATALTAGAYTITVTSNGCTATCSTVVGTLPDVTPPTINCPANITSCTSNVTYSTTGADNCGTPVISFLPPSGSNLPVGINTVTAKATDASGNTATCTFTVTVPASMILNAAKTNIRCGAVCNATIDIVVTGGNAPFIYAWAGGATGASLSNLCTGNYTCTVTDANGCTKSKTIAITGNATLTATVFPTSTTLAATAGGGVPPITYLWNTAPMQTNATATGLLPNHTYKVKVTDSKNCTKLVQANTLATKLNSANANGANINVYPNPTNGVVTLSITNCINCQATLTLYDLIGNVVYSNELKIENNTTLDFSHLAKGVYSLKVMYDGSSEMVKVVIQ